MMKTLKTHFILFVFFIACKLIYCQETVIKLCDLTPTKFVLKDTSYNVAIDKSFASALISIEPKKWKSYTIMAHSQKNYDLISCHYHPFIEVLNTAHANHRPVVISPDMIWLLITQGFANHVNENSEQLRKYFVDFEGKKVLKVKRDEMPVGKEWEGVIAEFNQEIAVYTGKELINTVVTNFSTTTDIERTAFQVTLMDATSQYFVYSMGFTCGIPEIRLEGTTEDWIKILEKTQSLRQYELDWWVDALIPVLTEFVSASAGNVNVAFWEKIHSLEKDDCTSTNYITGWINTFFPYYNTSRGLIKNTDFKRPLTAGRGDIENDYKMGISKAEVYFVFNAEDIHQFEFLGGFVGMKQDEKTLALRPEIGWIIRDTGKKGIKSSDKEYEAEIIKK